MPIAVLDPDLEKATARFFRVLGDPTRMRILELLSQGPLTVAEIVLGVGATQSRVSTHLACLKWCKFVEARRDGRQMIYSLQDGEVHQLIEMAKSIAIHHRDHLATCSRIGPDW